MSLCISLKFYPTQNSCSGHGHKKIDLERTWEDFSSIYQIMLYLSQNNQLYFYINKASGPNQDVNCTNNRANNEIFHFSVVFFFKERMLETKINPQLSFLHVGFSYCPRVFTFWSPLPKKISLGDQCLCLVPAILILT